MRSLFALALGLLAAGCTAKTSTTHDATKIEIEVPKVEVKKTPDLDLKTDDDVDVKTPAAKP